MLLKDTYIYRIEIDMFRPHFGPPQLGQHEWSTYVQTQPFPEFPSNATITQVVVRPTYRCEETKPDGHRDMQENLWIANTEIPKMIDEFFSWSLCKPL